MFIGKRIRRLFHKILHDIRRDRSPLCNARQQPEYIFLNDFGLCFETALSVLHAVNTAYDLTDGKGIDAVDTLFGVKTHSGSFGMPFHKLFEKL